ncbi:outer membrane beta-barrel protein [Pseudomonadota bacterium]
MSSIWWLGRTRQREVLSIVCFSFFFLGMNAEACAEDAWYVGGALGRVDGDQGLPELNKQISTVGVNATAQTSNSNRQGWKVFGGYQINANVSAEIGYVDLGDVNITFNGLSSEISNFLNTVQNIQPSSAKGLQFSTVGFYPLENYFSLTARAGVYVWEADHALLADGVRKNVENDGIDLVWGVGFSQRMGDRIDFRFELDFYEIEREKMDVISFNLIYSIQ